MANVSNLTLAFFFPSFVFLILEGNVTSLHRCVFCSEHTVHRDAGWLTTLFCLGEGNTKKASFQIWLVHHDKKGKICLEITAQTRKEYKRGHWHLKLFQLNNTATKTFYRSLAHHNPFKSKCCPATRNKGINLDHQLLCICWCDFDRGWIGIL